MIMRQILLCFSLVFAPMAFGQQSAPPAGAAAPTVRAYPAGGGAVPGYSGGATGQPAYGGAAQYHSGKRFYVTDSFANLKPDPRHATDFEPPNQHSINDFAPEPRNIFHLMDQVVSDVAIHSNGTERLLMPGEAVRGGETKTRKLKPLDFDVPPGVYDSSLTNQRAIYGRNTWMLWCGGDEDFWDWIAQNGYGVLDFLKVLDSRKRGSRLRDLGLINQPGLKSTDKPGPWGLRLDLVERTIGVEGNYSPGYGTNQSYEPYTDRENRTLDSDGVNPKVYGYPSGVIGLRLFPNPKFDAKAQEWWNSEAFYNDPVYAKDPRTVRPLLVGMSCVVCHIGPHPLNPPKNAEEPNWSNLSTIIGNQYFRTSAAFGGRVERANFLWHFLASQQPGTIDTSMVASDHINNGNGMNAVFELPARVARARLNPPELQGSAAKTLPGEGQSERRIPRVLMDGADSIGVFGALARVYLNIGTYHDEWNQCSNPIIGFAPQRPFSIDLCRRNSLYWRVNENFRVGYLMDFFLWENRGATAGEKSKRVQCTTAAMLLKDALVPSNDGKLPLKFIDVPDNKHHWDEAKALKGSQVFTRHCMVCHSSKQPEGFKIEFAHQPTMTETNWQKTPVDRDKLTLPFDEKDWEDFKKSPAYTDYVAKALQLAGDGDWERLQAFLEDNFLSTDLRIPVSLTKTSAARALASNAMQNQVWEEYASETYRQLPPVARISYYDPFTKKTDTFQPPGKGPGYYRVPPLVSIWATAPLLHNNALGSYLPDHEVNRRVSVEGRLFMFDNAINKLLSKEKRGQTPSGEAGLRDPSDSVWRGSDPGWIFRTDLETEIRIPRGHLRHLIEGVLPGFVPGWLRPVVLCSLNHPWVLPLLLFLLSLVLVFCWPRAYFYLILITGLVLVAVLIVTGIHYLLPSLIWLLPIALLVGGLFWIVSNPRRARESNTSERGQLLETTEDPRLRKKEKCIRTTLHLLRWSGVAAHGLFLVGLLATLWLGREFVDGRIGDLRVGPLPKGVPVNALMNMNPDAPLWDMLGAVRGLSSTIGKLRRADRLPEGKRLTDAERLAIFEKKAGPALMRVSKCPDFIMDRGHYFGESLSEEEKQSLVAFLKTL